MSDWPCASVAVFANSSVNFSPAGASLGTYAGRLSSPACLRTSLSISIFPDGVGNVSSSRGISRRRVGERNDPGLAHLGDSDLGAADPVCGLGRTPEVQGDPRPLWGADLGVEVLEPVVVSAVPERLLRRPRQLQDVQVLISPVVPLVLGHVVAVAALFGVAAAGDDVHRDPPPGELVEGREHPGGERGRHEPGPVCHQEAQPLGMGSGVRSHLGAVGLGGVVADEHPVEARVLVRLREAPRVVVVDDGPAGRAGLGLVLGADHADELDGHGLVLPGPVASERRPGRCQHGAPAPDMNERPMPQNHGHRISISN